ncbi:MAG: hypothetical protein K2H23_03730 [Oscillospiraceae bacterium]|nr:hypothetical protein [Oscillospiraceae bacterium]
MKNCKNKKVYEFCDAVHNKQYMKIYIKLFRRKCGKEYFKRIEYFFE